MATRIIIPHRGLERAKTRLAGVLDPTQRAALAERLLRHVLDVAVATGHEVVVISPDGGLEALVASASARLAVQRGLGLNAGLAQARDHALRDGVEVLAVLHGDLPDLAPDDVNALIGAVKDPGPEVAVAPDASERGTNGLALRPPDAMDFHFGPDSLAAHRAAAQRSGAQLIVVRRPGIAFDVDTPQDLAAWLERGHAA
ncbi:MAG: 2-phospho-L-lactate guanylyltransferase [Candidatus Limnocylindria bacterium]